MKMARAATSSVWIAAAIHRTLKIRCFMPLRTWCPSRLIGRQRYTGAEGGEPGKTHRSVVGLRRAWLRLGPADTDSARLNDEQVTRHVVLLKRNDPSAHDTDLLVGRRMRGKAKHNDSRVRSGWKSQNACKALVGRDEHVAMSDCVAVDGIVRGASQAEVTDVRCLITAAPQ